MTILYWIAGVLAACLFLYLLTALRHAGPGPGAPLTFEVGDVRVDLGRRVVERGGTPVHLTRTEYRLLEALVRGAGRVRSPIASCSRPSGGPTTSTRHTTCASAWASFARSWRPIPCARSCCAPSPASGIACTTSAPKSPPGRSPTRSARDWRTRPVHETFSA